MAYDWANGILCWIFSFISKQYLYRYFVKNVNNTFDLEYICGIYFISPVTNQNSDEEKIINKQNN